jgi:ribosome-binding ATPase YchF (GTP1/OBG family)
MMDDRDYERLDRIEEKIDKLADAMVTLARTEEKILSMEQQNQNNLDRMNKFSDKLDGIERKVNENAHTVHIINRLAWVVAVAIIGAIVKFFWI